MDQLQFYRAKLGILEVSSKISKRMIEHLPGERRERFLFYPHNLQALKELQEDPATLPQEVRYFR